MLQNALWMFICFQHGKWGKGDYFSRGERAEFTPRKKVGNFHVSQQLLSMIVAVSLRGHHSGDSRPDILLRAIAHVQHTPPSKRNMDWLDCNGHLRALP